MVNLFQKFIEIYGDTSTLTVIMRIGIILRMSVPLSTNLISCVDALSGDDQCKACGVKRIIAIMNKDIVFDV